MSRKSGCWSRTATTGTHRLGQDATYHGTYDGNARYNGLPVALALGNQNVFTAPDEDERGQIFWDLMGDDADDFVLTQGGQEGTLGTLTGPDEPIALVFITPLTTKTPPTPTGTASTR